MNIILFDSISRLHLLPLTYTRPVAALRAGAFTIAEKWEKISHHDTSFLAAGYLQKAFPPKLEADFFLINGALLPDDQIFKAICALNQGEVMKAPDGTILAARTGESSLALLKTDGPFIDLSTLNFHLIEYSAPYLSIEKPWHLFSNAAKLISYDFDTLTKGRKSQAIPEGNRFVHPENIFIEEGASVSFSVINATDGPVYIGRDAEIMENCTIRGPFILGDHSTLKMGAKVYGPTIIGPHCKIGGEINNSVFLGFSNKAHDGFLGNSVIGQWCNLGADTNNSNLKNTYEEVKLWSHVEERFVKTGLQFCGLIMGDHSKCGINTMFNTGTVVGVSCNLFGDGFHRNFIPSYSWGSPQHMTSFQLDKAIHVAERVMSRRGIQLPEYERDILTHLYQLTATQRRS